MLCLFTYSYSVDDSYDRSFFKEGENGYSIFAARKRDVTIKRVDFYILIVPEAKMFKILSKMLIAKNNVSCL